MDYFVGRNYCGEISQKQLASTQFEWNWVNYLIMVIIVAGFLIIFGWWVEIDVFEVLRLGVRLVFHGKAGLVFNDSNRKKYFLSLSLSAQTKFSQINNFLFGSYKTFCSTIDDTRIQQYCSLHHINSICIGKFYFRFIRSYRTAN